jgi:hypothetical protein
VSGDKDLEALLHEQRSMSLPEIEIKPIELDVPEIDLGEIAREIKRAVTDTPAQPLRPGVGRRRKKTEAKLKRLLDEHFGNNGSPSLNEISKLTGVSRARVQHTGQRLYPRLYREWYGDRRQR